ncbi:multifunctional transcriptional regulator/nicotinamide-nucleotide adenylyltransferase/ribosylnicotinamide kinase NadR [Orbus hercynius]|nr:multifunctional transcriptional regulator/nicotinamide-nucleotide adenylyltransferase/ribosylnicotinamide kinase NadR [Orbus hercynius]
MNISSVATHQIGLVFGKFYPLHCGHIYLIEKAASQVDELHILLGCEQNRDLKLFQDSHMPRQPGVEDRFLWLQKTFKNRHNVHTHVLDEAGIASYPNGWQDWSDRVKSILDKHHVVPSVIFTSEPQDVEHYKHYFQTAVKLIDADRDFVNISATKIRQQPYDNWHFIAQKARPFFIKRIAIIGRSEFSKVPKQLANIYNTEYVGNGYVNYINCSYQDNANLVFNKSDYISMAKLHAERLHAASLSANRVLFTSLDFRTLHHYYQTAFQSSNTILQELEENYPFDLIINETDFDDCDSALSVVEEILKMVEKQLH